MKGFIKFASILMFGVFCFIAGAAKGTGKGDIAIYYVFIATAFLINGFNTVVDIETGETYDKYAKTIKDRSKDKRKKKRES